MSSREPRDRGILWVPPTIPGILDVGKMKSFWLLHVIAITALSVSLILVCVPFDSLRVKKDIEKIHINLSENRVPYLIRISPKELMGGEKALYYSTTFQNHTVGNVTFGNTTDNLPSYCKVRLLAAYHNPAVLKGAMGINIYDFFVGAIKVTRYIKSDIKTDAYLNYDSSIYIMPLPYTRTIMLKANVYELLHEDIEHVIRTHFVGNNGKIYHEVMTPNGVRFEEIQIGQERIVVPALGNSISLQAIELPQHNIIKITIRSSGTEEQLFGKDYYLHTDDWGKVYVDKVGLEALLKSRNITVEGVEDLFTFNRINLTGKLAIPATSQPYQSNMTHFYNVTIEGWKYVLVVGDVHHIIGKVEIGATNIEVDTSATDRVILIYSKDETKASTHGWVCTKVNGNYTYEQINEKPADG